MNVAPNAPKRPALRYYGGKWRLASWIISFFPEHVNYVEPCGGAASVLLQKPRSPLETYNDLDSNVVNFFRVLRDRPDELIRKIRLTPWARAEYKSHHESASDDIEWARRFWIGMVMSIGNMAYSSSGMRMTKNEDGMPGMPDVTVQTDQSHLEHVAARLLGVQIENKPYQEILTMYDHPANLFYMDPPYVDETRATKKYYIVDWNTNQHIEAAALLHQCQGYIVISGYACPLYTELYEAHGWERHDKVAQTNSGGKRVESVWLSPRTVEALSRPKQMKLGIL